MLDSAVLFIEIRSMFYFIFVRNCCPGWGWFVVVYTASYFAKDVWEDMSLIDEVDEIL